MTFKLAILAAASALSFGAQATTTDWGAHDPLEVAAAITPVGVFSDSYLFSLSSAVSLFSTAVSNNLTGVLGIETGMVSLFQESGAVDIAIGDFAFDDTTGSISHSFGALASGDYYYLVSGTGTGTLGGFYTLSSTVSAVPEPQTYALLLGGLGAIGFMVLRRRV
jgi:PEP-CTERM motif